jgi:phospholipid-binding lipoprotein MlaA
MSKGPASVTTHPSVCVLVSRIALAAALAIATQARAGEPSDPLEGANRAGYSIHQALDRALFRPAAMIYRALTPGFIGKGIHNVMVNLSEPVTFANDVLQLRPRRAAHTLIRLTANTLAGWGGFMDVAGYAGLEHRHNSFGNTLGRYGVGPGPYLFIPFIGPSDVRDLFGSGVDAAIDPVRFITYPHRTRVNIVLSVVGGLDQRSFNDDDLKAATAGAADPYATLRSLYLQDRQGEIDGTGKPPADLPDIASPNEQPAMTPEPAPAAPSPPESAPPPPSAAVAVLDEDAPMVTAGGDTKASL